MARCVPPLFVEYEAFPSGGRWPSEREGRMRANLPPAPRSRAIAANSPLIRLRAGPQTPSPLGGKAFSALTAFSTAFPAACNPAGLFPPPPKRRGCGSGGQSGRIHAPRHIPVQPAASRRAAVQTPACRCAGCRSPSGCACRARRFWASARPGIPLQTADSMPGTTPAYGPVPRLSAANPAVRPPARAVRRRAAGRRAPSRRGPPQKRPHRRPAPAPMHWPRPSRPPGRAD